MTTRDAGSFTFTGWHMLGVIGLFFGTIISVNFYMAYQAVHSWSGLVVENTYVASQQFNAKVNEAKQLNASGITDVLSVTPSKIEILITDAKGQPAFADEVFAIFKRPVGDHQDFRETLQPLGRGVYAVERTVQAGHWIVDISALKDGSRILHHSQRIAVMGEAR